MSGYTEISDPVDDNTVNISAPPTENQSDMYQNNNDNIYSTEAAAPKSATNTPANSIEFDDNLTIGFVPKILTFIGVAAAACGLIINLSGIAAIPLEPSWLPILGIIAPLFIMMLLVFNRASHAFWLDTAVVVLSAVAAIYTFFDFIAFAQYGDGPYGAAAAGGFIVFAGEAAVCTAAVLALCGF